MRTWNDQTATNATQDSADERNQQALGEKLANDARAARAERAPHSDLAAACRRAGEQEVRNVRAGDQQHERERRHDRAGADQRDVADSRYRQRCGARNLECRRAAGLLGVDPRGDDVELRPHLLRLAARRPSSVNQLVRSFVKPSSRGSTNGCVEYGAKYAVG